jgi:hypothetical protein
MLQTFIQIFIQRKRYLSCPGPFLATGRSRPDSNHEVGAPEQLGQQKDEKTRNKKGVNVLIFKIFPFLVKILLVFTKK